jgi:hypothetical protein
MNTQLLRNLAEQANQLPPKDLEKLDYLIQKNRMYINQIYGSESSYHKTLDSIKFFPSYYYPGSYDISWKTGCEKLKNLIYVMEEENSIIEKARELPKVKIHKIEIKQSLIKKFQKILKIICDAVLGKIINLALEHFKYITTLIIFLKKWGFNPTI